jgi:GNAT superfamily N-acetyltransferase
MIGRFVRFILRAICREYSYYHVYRFDGPPLYDCGDLVTPIRAAGELEGEIAELAEYIVGEQSAVFAYKVDGRPVAACCFWWGETYRRLRGFWPVADGEAKLVQIITNSDFRGRGIGSRLIAAASSQMLQRGFTSIYARIWHSNVASQKAFTHAGWCHVANVIECKFRFLPDSARIRYRLGVRRTAPATQVRSDVRA